MWIWQQLLFTIWQILKSEDIEQKNIIIDLSEALLLKTVFKEEIRASLLNQALMLQLIITVLHAQQIVHHVIKIITAMVVTMDII
jgi:hypothetical protein